MNNYRKTLLALPLIILAGCNSSSSSGKATTKAQVKPKADYVFSSVKLGKLYQEREELQESMKLTYGGVQYDQIQFAEDISEKQKVVRLASRLGQSVDLYFPDAGFDSCGIYTESKGLDVFDCGAALRSVSNETTLIQTTTNSTKAVELEFQNELSQYVTSLGSTILSKTKRVTRSPSPLRLLSMPFIAMCSKRLALLSEFNRLWVHPPILSFLIS